jgi:prevent-host-death family protein
VKTMTAANAKNRFGQLLDAAQREPVVITKNDRPVGVLLSMQDYDDAFLGAAASKAVEGGYAGPEESAKAVERWLKAGE